MNVTVYAIQGAKSGVLTTEHARSSYGLPVLIIDGAVFGPSDALPGNPESGPQLAREAHMTRADSLIPDFYPMSTEDVDCTADNEADAEFQALLAAFKQQGAR